ncbi:MAG: ATP-binding cassette domain-containing protein [Holosporales bacterium]|jgi:polar amino acid transport system ATP-binding protein|nr:ATP-binding cassette domain-containing protein [Holosporales bacterium]
MLRICNIGKSFNNIAVLNDVSVHVEESSILGLAGPSGSGKSTLLRCIQGLEKPDAGSIKYDGKIGFMFQDFQLFPHMTVLQNLVYTPTRKAASEKKQQYIAKANTLLKELGIGAKAGNYPSTLSGGQKQRVALARSLMIDPDLLLCDEPTSGLDVATISDVVALLRKVHKRNVTIIIASHDLDFLVEICDRIMLLKSGQIIADVRPSQHTNTALHLKSFYDFSCDDAREQA